MEGLFSVTSSLESVRILFGIVGCRDTIPNLQRIAVYVRDALDDLQSAIEAPKPRRKTASVRKKKTASKA